MNIKKELIFGVITILLIFFAIFFSINKFNNKTENLVRNALPTTSQNQINLTMEELVKHNVESDCWLLINNKLYDVTNYLSSHPGGAGLVIPYCGKESTQAFETKAGKGSHSAKATIDLKKYYIGDLNEK